MPLLTVVEATTGALNFQLFSGSSPIDLTGATVILLLQDNTDTIVVFTGTITVTSATLGKVAFNPASGDLVASASPYFARFKVVDAGAKTFFCPSSYRDQWDIITQ